MSETAEMSEQNATGANGRVTYRDVTDMMARVEKDLAAGQSRIEGKIDAFILSHTTTHANEQAELRKHLVSAAIMEERSSVTDRRTDSLMHEVHELREWRAELRGMSNLVKFAVGSSAIGAAVSVVTLVIALSRL